MDHRPEVLYRRSLPEALNSDSLSTNTLESNRISKRQPVYSLLRNTFRTRKKIQVILVLMLLVCAAIGIGLGMKFGRGKPAPTDRLACPFTHSLLFNRKGIDVETYTY